MRTLIKKYLITTISLFSLTQVIPAVTISGGWNSLFYASFVLSLLLYIAKPIANLIVLPINILTLNLFSWIIQVAIFFLFSVVVSEVDITSWQVSPGNLGPIIFSSLTLSPWQVIILSAIMITFLMKILDWVF